MACGYKFNGKNFSNKSDLTDYIKNNIDEIPSNVILELLDTASDENLFAEKEAKLFRGSNFANISDNGLSSMVQPITFEYVKAIMEKERNAKLKSIAPRLADFANKLGVSVEFIKKDGVSGVARIADGVIAISLGEDMIDSYYEEMSHTLRERFKDKLSNEELSDFVKTTDEYAKHSDKYRMVYQSEGVNNEELERKVNLEIFDKILAKELKNELTGTPSSLNNQLGLWDTIRQWIRDFISWTKNEGANSARKTLRDIIKAVNNQNVSSFSNKNFEFKSYYRLNEASAVNKSLANDLIAGVHNTIASIRANKGSDAVLSNIVNQIYGFGEGDGIATNKMLSSFTEVSKRLLQDMNEDIDNLSNSNSVLERKDLALISLFVNDVVKVLPATKKEIQNGKLDGVKSVKEKNYLSDKVDELDINISKLKEKYDKYIVDFILKKLDADHKLIGTSQDIIDKMKDSFQDGVAKDIGFVQRWLFSGHTSSSAIETLFHTLRHNMQLDYENKTINNITEVSKDLDRLNVSFNEFNTLIDKDKNGKPTGFIISPYLRDLLNNITVDKIFAEVDQTILTKDIISDIVNNDKTIYDLTPDQKEQYEYAYNKVDVEITEKKFIDEYYLGKDAEMEFNIKSVFPDKSDLDVKRLKKAISLKTSPLYRGRAEILAKYKDDMSILDMKYDDNLQFNSISSQIKYLSNTYNEIGSEKTGEALEIAKVLQFSMENYKAQEEDLIFTERYSDYLDRLDAKNLNTYQVMKRTGSIIFNEEDSINTALHELGRYNIFSDSPLLDSINAYLPDGKRLILSTPVQSIKDGIIVQNKLSDDENKKVIDAISTLKEIRKSILSPHKIFGEIKVGVGGLFGTTLDNAVKLEDILGLVKATQVLTKEEKELSKKQGIGFIPTDNFYNDYGYVDIEKLDDIESFPKNIDDNISVRKITYVLTNNSGKKEYYDEDGNKVTLSDAELIRKSDFEDEHMKEVGGKIKKLVPKFYYTKVVNEVVKTEFKGDNPVIGVSNPQERAVYVSSTSGNHYNYNEQSGKFDKINSPDKTKGERYVTFRGKTFLVNIKPNSIWKGMFKTNEMLNPNFNENIPTGTKQYKKIINVNSKPISILNDAYFAKFGISKDNIWGEATINKNLWEAKKIVLQNDHELLKNIGVSQDFYLRPQVRITPDEILYAKGGLKNATKAWLNRNIYSNIQDVDELSSVNVDKKASIKEGKQRNKLVDNYNRLIDRDELTNNLLSSYFTRAEMAIRYNERAKNLAEADMLMSIAKDVAYSLDESNTSDPGVSKTYASMKDNYVSDFFGAQQIEIGTFMLLGKRVSINKTIHTLRGYLTGRALGFNKYTGISSAIGGWVAKQKLSYVGKYGTRADYKFISDSISYMDMAKDFGNKITSDKILRMAEYMGIVDIKDILARANRPKNINRATFLANPFSFLQAGDMPRIAESMIIGLLQYRKVNGQWYSRDTFLEKFVNQDKKTMSDANFIWDANQKNALFHEVMQYYNENDKTLNIKDDELKGLFSKASYIGKKHHTDLTGNIKGVDSANAFRNPLTSPIGMFKNFFINTLQNRFSEDFEDQYTGAARKGSYRYIQFSKEWAQLLAYAIMNLQSKINDPNNGLTYQEMQALRMIQMDTYATLAALVVAMLLRAMADDDDYEDVWVVQAAAHAAAKTFSEVASGDIYAIPFQGYDIIKSPYRSFMTFGSDVGGLVLGGEDVSRGTFKGYDKRAASAIKLTPMGLSNLYNIIGDDAEVSRNNLYKDSWLWDVYEKVAKE